jgi:site-specific DNA-adenine methylase
MSQFGIPYMGSKHRIIPSIAMNLPPAKHFYDLFGGGFSVTQYMIEKRSKRYEFFHYNEIKKDITELVKKAINGDFNYNKFKPEWISTEAFNARKHDDAFIQVCWSFGGNLENYLFSTKIEPYKKSMHMAVVFDEFDSLASEVFGFNKWPDIEKTVKQKRIFLRQKIEWYRQTKIPKTLSNFLIENKPRSLMDLDNLMRLERLQQLHRLQRFQWFQWLSITSKDYREIEILPESIVYCDIPYQGTHDYGNEFNHKEFFDWASSRKFPVYISEYNIDDLRFKCIYEIDKIPLFCNSYKIIKSKVEKLYWNGVSIK